MDAFRKPYRANTPTAASSSASCRDSDSSTSEIPSICMRTLLTMYAHIVNGVRHDYVCRPPTQAAGAVPAVRRTLNDFSYRPAQGPMRYWPPRLYPQETFHGYQ